MDMWTCVGSNAYAVSPGYRVHALVSHTLAVIAVRFVGQLHSSWHGLAELGYVSHPVALVSHPQLHDLDQYVCV